MESSVLTEMIAVIRAERERRASLLRDEDSDAAYDQWMSVDWPFVNELCLMILITLWHQVERELVAFAARAGDEGRVIDGRRYRERVEQLRRGRGWNWKTINSRLSLESCERYGAIEALHLLANSYKHDPSVEPSEELKEYLQLPEVDYAPLPESDLFRERFAAFVGLEVKAGYCEIAEALVGITGDFLKSVESRTRLSTVRWGPIPLDRFAH